MPFQATTIAWVLRQHFWLILCLAVAGAVLTFVLCKLSKQTYTSTITIEVNRISDTPLGTSTLNGTPQQFNSAEEMNASLLTNVAELQSASVALAVINQLHLNQYPPYYDAVTAEATGAQSKDWAQERTLRLFKTQLKVALVKDTKLVEVTFTDPNPYRAAAVANAVVNTYLASDVTARNMAATASTNDLTSQLSDLRREVLAAEKRVTDYKQQTGVLGTTQTGASSVGVPSADEAATDRLVELNRALTAAEVNLVQKRAIAQVTQSTNPDAVLDLTSGSLGTGSSGSNPLASERADLTLLASLREQHSKLAVTQASSSETYGNKSPQMQQLQSQLKEVDGQILRELRQVRNIAQSDYQLAQDNAAGLRGLVKEQQQTVTRMNVGGNQLLILEQEASSDRKLYQDLFAKLEEATVSASVKSSNVSIVDPARPSMTPSSPKTLQDTAMGMVAGILLGVFLAFLLDYLKHPEPGMSLPSTASSGEWRSESPSAVSREQEQTL
jgi:uncharacterized protein involved in exopolysaccharide biosynthesis